MKTKHIKKIAIGGLSLSAISSAGQSLGGTNFAGNFAQGVGSAMPAVGSLYGASMITDAAKQLRVRKLARRK